MAKFFCILPRFSVPARVAAFAAIVFGFAVSVSLAAVVDGEKRVALVIGNGAYVNAVRLDNAVFDARAVATASGSSGLRSSTATTRHRPDEGESFRVFRRLAQRQIRGRLLCRPRYFGG